MTTNWLTGTAVEQPVGTPLAAQGRDYAYDPIGNRTRSTLGAENGGAENGTSLIMEDQNE